MSNLLPPPRYPIPEPPLDERATLRVGHAMLVAALRSGCVGGCVVCRSSSVTWLDLDELDMDPVADGDGHLNDHAPLHERCVTGVLEFWASVVFGDPGEEDPEPFVGGRPPSPNEASPRRQPRGAYARRGVS